MSDADHPGGKQEYDSGQAFGAPPSHPDQPGYDQPGSMPPTYENWVKIAFAGAVLCNMILGFPAAYLARMHGREVAWLWDSGNVNGAVMASRKARAWLIASGVLDVLGLIVLIVLIAPSSGSNFNSPSAVAASIKTLVQQQISDSSGPDYVPGVTVTSVACTPSGTLTDHCVIRFSDGIAVTKTATISADGKRYYTH
jgi:Interferon-induced transmembrane protein